MIARAATPRSPRTGWAADASGGASPRANALYSVAELAQQHGLRPRVGHDVVHRQRQHVVVGGQPDEQGPEDGPGREIEAR